jgi:hypothetical protein
MTDTQNQFSKTRGLGSDILADRALDDMVRRLDAVRDLHEQANTSNALQEMRFLVGDALRQVADFLFELRRRQQGI